MSSTKSITVRVPLAIRRRPGRKTIVRAGGPEAELVSTAVHADPAMVKALARAFHWQRMLNEGRYCSISEIAAAEKIDRGYVGSILRLTLLAPMIVEAIIDGRHPTELQLSVLMKPFPLTWSDQCATFLSQAPQQANSATADAVTHHTDHPECI